MFCFTSNYRFYYLRWALSYRLEALWGRVFRSYDSALGIAPSCAFTSSTFDLAPSADASRLRGGGCGQPSLGYCWRVAVLITNLLVGRCPQYHMGSHFDFCAKSRLLPASRTFSPHLLTAS